MAVPTSSAQAQSFHSITIGDDTNGYKNTWDDWHLVPSSRPLISPPPVKESFVELVGGDGYLDLTEKLSGKPVYGNRTGTWEFIVINDGQISSSVPYRKWTVLYSDIMRWLHGKRYRIVLNDEPGWYYTGRLVVAGWSSNPNNSTITIGYNVEPYKRSLSNSNLKKF